MAAMPLSEQIIEIEKLLRDDARRFQVLVDKGRWKQETADRKLAALRAVQSTLTWLEKNHDWIKAEALRRDREARATAEFEREVAEMESEPIVTAALEAFPGGEVTDIRPATTPPENQTAKEAAAP